MESNVFTLQVGTTFSEKLEGYLGAEYRTFDASMGGWDLDEVFADPAAVPTDPFFDHVSDDWESIPGFSDVDLEVYDVTLGLRYRGLSGWGWSGEYTVSRYGDEEPILEDETGTWSRFTLLVGKSF